MNFSRSQVVRERSRGKKKITILGKTSLLGSHSVDGGTCLQVARSQSIDLSLNKYQIGDFKKIKPSSAYRKSVVIAYFEERKKICCAKCLSNFSDKTFAWRAKHFLCLLYFEKNAPVSTLSGTSTLGSQS